MNVVSEAGEGARSPPRSTPPTPTLLRPPQGFVEQLVIQLMRRLFQRGGGATALEYALMAALVAAALVAALNALSVVFQD